MREGGAIILDPEIRLICYVVKREALGRVGLW